MNRLSLLGFSVFAMPVMANAEATNKLLTLDAQPAPVSQPAPDAQSDMSVIRDIDLDKERGGQVIVVTNQTLTAISQGSVLNGNYSAGAVSISDNAMSSFSGFGNILINTGALNNLQSGMNVTINVSN